MSNTEETKKVGQESTTKRKAVVFHSKNQTRDIKAGNRPEGNAEKRPANGEKKPFNGENRPNREGGERRQGSENRGERKPFNGEGGERRPNREGGERRQGGENRGERKPFGGEGGERRPNREGGERRQGGENRGERRPYNGEGGERRPNREGGERRSFNGENRGERRPYNGEGGERRPNRDGGERRSFNGENRGNGERKPFNGEGGERRPNRDGARRPFNGEGGERRPNRDGGERRPFNGENRGNGEGRSFNGNRDGANRNGAGRDGSANRGGFGDRRPSGGSSRPSDGGMRSEAFAGKPSSANNKATRKQDNNKGKGKYDKHNSKEDNFAKLEKNDQKNALKNSNKNKASKPVEEEVKTIVLPESITIKDLADKMKIQAAQIVKKLFMAGQMVTINQEVDYETAEGIALDFDFLCEKEVKVDVIEELLKDTEDPEDTLAERAPVVCVMGHVDHGKTSLLDAIRNTHVTARESGGITQHIGAYMVECNGQPITFLDTPGHEAFTAMRLRGAMATDIAVLVVAADDGVMPQTVEAISHAKAAGVDIIVAVNKIDKPAANIERVKQELTEHGLVAEDWGGDTIFVPVSAHTGEGIDELLEMILLASEVKELKANPNRKARGLVVEALLDKGRGPVATVLVQKGTLRVGDNIAVGSCYGKVRAMLDENDRRVKEAGPSKPVAVLGLNDVPGAGEVFVVTETDKDARNFAETFIAENRERMIEETKGKMSLDDLFSQIKAGSLKELDLIIKADVQGSVEAVKQSMLKLSNEEVIVKCIHGGVGAINESDVNLAIASSAIIIGFNVRPDATARELAEREKVDVRLYKVIYQAIADVEAAMKGMLDPIFEERVIGHAVVRQTFKASGVGIIAGSYITDGKFSRGCKCRLSRGGEQLFDGNLASLKRFKDDVKDVNAGYECGLVLEGFTDIREDDEIEAYEMVEVPRS